MRIFNFPAVGAGLTAVLAAVVKTRMIALRQPARGMGCGALRQGRRGERKGEGEDEAG